MPQSPESSDSSPLPSPSPQMSEETDSETLEAEDGFASAERTPTVDLPASDTIADELCAIHKKLEALTDSASANERKDEILKSLHDELQTYKSGSRREYIFPILMNIIKWEGHVTEIYSHYFEKEKRGDGDAAAMFSALLEEYKKLSLGLRDLVEDYGLITVAPEVGEIFEPRKHKRVVTQESDDPAKSGVIARTTAVGYADLETGRTFKQAEVEVFETKPQES